MTRLAQPLAAPVSATLPLALLLAGATSLMGVPTAGATTTAPRQIGYRHWDSVGQLRTGTFAGTTPAGGKLRITRPVRTTTVAGRRYGVGTWTSPWVRPGFSLT